MTSEQGLTGVMTRLAELNALHYRANGEIPPILVIAPATRRDSGACPFDVLPLESITRDTTRRAIADAFLTVTVLEGYVKEQRRDESGRFPLEAIDVETDPDARRCLVYFAQCEDGTRVAALQYVLRPEHGPARLAPLKVLTDCNVAIMDSDLTDLTRPGRNATPRHDMH